MREILPSKGEVLISYTLQHLLTASAAPGSLLIQGESVHHLIQKPKWLVHSHCHTHHPEKEFKIEEKGLNVLTRKYKCVPNII